MKRKAHYKVKESLNQKRIPILIGLRRVGKTTILKQLAEEYNDSIILTFDDIVFRSKNDLEIIEYIDSLVVSGKKYIFIDEIQTRPKWDLIVKNLFDRYVDTNKANFVVTGSSSLSFESKDTGVTRTEKILIHTLDFSEYLELSGKESNFDNFEYFLTYGGFPEFIGKDVTVEDMLNLSLQPILNDDIPSNYKINVNNLIKLLVELASLTNGEFNKNKSSQRTGIKIDQISTYLQILERTHIIKTVDLMRANQKPLRYTKQKIYINPHFHIWLLRQEFKLIDNKMKGHIVESYWLFWSTQLNGYYKKFFYLKDQNNKEIDFVSLDTSGFKTLHEIKYSNDATQKDYSLMKSIKSKNKIVWCKETTKSSDGLINFISILDAENN